MKKKTMSVLLAVLMLMLPVLTACGKDQDTFDEIDAEAQGYACAVYREQGCAKMVWATGSELEMQSGSTLDIQDGSTIAIYDLTVNDTLDVDGDIDLDGDGFDVNITAGFSIDGDLASNISIAAGDLTIDAETGSVNIIGSEAAINAVYIDANDTVTSGVDIDTGTASGLRIDGGPFSVDGTGAFNVNTAVGDISVEAETGSVTIKGDEAAADAIYLDANEAAGTGITAIVGTAGTFGVTGYIADFNMTGGVSIDADLASNFNTLAGDITFEAETGSVIIKGDEEVADAILLNAATTITQGIDINVGSVYGLSIDGGLTNFGTGTYATADGDNDVGIEGDLEVNTSIDLDGTGFDADVSSAISLDAGATSNLNTSAGDIQLEAETGSVWIKADEELADAIHLDANATITQGIDIDLGSVYGMSVDGGLTDFGTGTYDVADGDEDVGVDGVLEVNGLARLDGGATLGAGDLTISNGLFLPSFDDLTLSDGDWITPTTITVYGLDTSGAVTITLGACSNEGQFLYLIGDDANAIIINDTNIRTSTGNALTINQWDIVAWVCQDTEWLELFIIANS